MRLASLTKCTRQQSPRHCAAAERLSPLQSLSASGTRQAIEEATLAATQSLAVELVQVPTPAHQEEVQTSTTGQCHVTVYMIMNIISIHLFH
jgi:hypothetical protein